MTCLIDRVLDGTGMKSHSSMLGKFFVYTLAICMPIFKKKSPRRFFLENCHTWCQGIYKKRPQHRSMWLHPCPVQNSVYQASHCSPFLKVSLNFCSRVYINHVSYLLNDVFLRYLRVRFLIVEQTDAYALELYLSELLH